MQLTCPVLPSQRGHHAAEYHHHNHDTRSHSRQPLGESTGNIPYHAIAGGGALPYHCAPVPRELSSQAPSLGRPLPPLESQHHGGGPSSLALRRQYLQMQKRQRHGINPFYLEPGFQKYRKNQAEKDNKSEQKWPEMLEDAFLDALLLIPQMGRRKYTMQGRQYGRNMLISKYLWLVYELSLVPGARGDAKLKRERKQVSSHLQVLRAFFKHKRCYHFFFPLKEKKGRKDDRRDLEEMQSFKDNPVLKALSENRMPEERPNYEYFAQLLASDALVAVRPNLCWILISSTAVSVRADGPLRCDAFKSDGERLDAAKYPHLALNLKRDEWPERGKIIRGTLLQEYTRTLKQREATSVKDMAADWEDDFPELHECLEQAAQENLHDILHFHVTLDVQESDQFPEASDLNALVEITIEQPGLQNHDWKSVTKLARPWELTRGVDSGDVNLVEIQKKMGNQYTHRPGCDNRENRADCDCAKATRLRRQQMAVPFPADDWAIMLSQLATFRKHPLDDKRRGPKTDRGADDADADPTQMDLIKKVAMFQELWSCPPDGSQGWTRRAVVAWTFETAYIIDDKYKSVSKGKVETSWRFLTALDPASPYHQQQALLSPQSSSALATQRGRGPSPLPSYQQHAAEGLSESFGSAWAGGSLSPPLTLPTFSSNSHASGLPAYENSAPPPVSYLDSFSGGLSTPGSTVSLQSAYPLPHQQHTFDTNQSHHDFNNQMSFMNGTASSAALDSNPTLTAADSFLSATAYDDASPVDSALAAWADGPQQHHPHPLPIDSRLDAWPATTAGFAPQSQPLSAGSWQDSALVPDLKIDTHHPWSADAWPAGGGHGTGSTTTPTSEWMPAPAGWDDDNGAGAEMAPPPQPPQQQQVGGQGESGYAAAAPRPLSPLNGGQKRGRTDSLDNLVDSFPMTAMPKLTLQTRVGKGYGGW